MKGMYYISFFLLITNRFKSSAFVDDVYFFSFSRTVSIRFNEFLWNMCNAKTSSGEAKLLNPWVLIRNMKCNTLLLLYLFTLFLHFKFLVDNGFNEFCFHKLSTFAFSFSFFLFYMLL